MPAFANGLELGVTTLELDVQITQDGHAFVTHDRQVSAAKRRDTGPEYPYVGDYVTNLNPGAGVDAGLRLTATGRVP